MEPRRPVTRYSEEGTTQPFSNKLSQNTWISVYAAPPPGILSMFCCRVSIVANCRSSGSTVWEDWLLLFQPIFVSHTSSARMVFGSGSGLLGSCRTHVTERPVQRSRLEGLAADRCTEHLQCARALISRLSIISVRNIVRNIRRGGSAGTLMLDPSFLFETPASNYVGRGRHYHRHRPS